MYSSIHYLFAFVLLLSLQFHKEQHRERDGKLKTEVAAGQRPWACFSPATHCFQNKQNFSSLPFPWLGWWKSFVSPKFLSTVIHILLMWRGHRGVPKWWGRLPCAEEARRKAGVDGEGTSMPQVHRLPSPVPSGGAGFCEQEEWTGFRSTCTMNRFRFAIPAVIWCGDYKGNGRLSRKGWEANPVQNVRSPAILPPQARLPPQAAERWFSDWFPVARPWQLTVPSAPRLINWKGVSVGLNRLHACGVEREVQISGTLRHRIKDHWVSH